MKVKIDIDEVFPVYSFYETDRTGDFVFELEEDLFKEFIKITHHYYEMQEILRQKYESEQRRVSESICGYRVPKGSEISRTQLNTINKPTQTQV